MKKKKKNQRDFSRFAECKGCAITIHTSTHKWTCECINRGRKKENREDCEHESEIKKIEENKRTEE